MNKFKSTQKFVNELNRIWKQGRLPSRVYPRKGCGVYGVMLKPNTPEKEYSKKSFTYIEEDYKYEWAKNVDMKFVDDMNIFLSTMTQDRFLSAVKAAFEEYIALNKPAKVTCSHKFSEKFINTCNAIVIKCENCEYYTEIRASQQNWKKGS